jgi:LuxR family maltose regulon positive regulatory protein
MTALINEIATLPYQFVLILDDYHTLTADKIHDSISFLLDHLPPQLHIILTTRTEPPLPLARLRANHALNELTVADLRFTDSEITAFLRDIFNLSLPPAAIQTLSARTEGWIAAIQLIALSLHNKPDPAAYIQKISGEHRHLTDYFTQEILAQQPPQIRDFLLQTAILDRCCTSLCQAITGDLDSPAIIDYLLDNNLFLIPLDDDRTWFRYHNLFADHLRQRLIQEQGENISHLYLLAPIPSTADWQPFP